MRLRFIRSQSNGIIRTIPYNTICRPSEWSHSVLTMFLQKNHRPKEAGQENLTCVSRPQREQEPKVKKEQPKRLGEKK